MTDNMTIVLVFAISFGCLALIVWLGLRGE